VNTKEFGAKGEYLARRFLEEKGYLFIRANFATGEGEIDLIMQENDEIVFVEVKTRTRTSAQHYGRGADAITKEKQTRIRKAARVFMQQEPRLVKDLVPRFDAVELYMEREGENRIYVLHTPCAF
jgi:putative endonuclease